MKQIIGLVKDRNPQGSPEELEAGGIPLNEWGACCAQKRDPDGEIQFNVLGCPVYKKCKLPQKGNGGPTRLGVRIIKLTPTGMRVIQRPLSCYNLPKEQRRAETNGGVCEVIAQEGEKMEVVRALPVDVDVPGVGKVRRWEEKATTITIEPFPRPKDNPIFKEQALAFKSIREFRAREASERPAKLLGFKPKPIEEKSKD